MAPSIANFVNVIAYVANLVFNYGAAAGWFGETITIVSTKYQTLIDPAGYAFSIWGLIFIAEGLFVIAQLVPKYQSNPLASSTPIVTAWVAACIFQISWLISFCREIIWLSAVMLPLICFSLGLLLVNQQKIIKQGEASIGALTYILFVFPFSVHFSWVTAASFVNFNIALVRYQPTNATNQLSLALATLVILGVLAGFLHKNHVFTAVLSWAIGAISSELSHPVAAITNLFGDVIVHAVHEATMVIAIVLAAITVLGAIKSAVCSGCDKASSNGGCCRRKSKMMVASNKYDSAMITPLV